MYLHAVLRDQASRIASYSPRPTRRTRPSRVWYRNTSEVNLGESGAPSPVTGREDWIAPMASVTVIGRSALSTVPTVALRSTMMLMSHCGQRECQIGKPNSQRTRDEPGTEMVHDPGVTTSDHSSSFPHQKGDFADATRLTSTRYRTGRLARLFHVCSNWRGRWIGPARGSVRTRKQVKRMVPGRVGSMRWSIAAAARLARRLVPGQSSATAATAAYGAAGAAGAVGAGAGGGGGLRRRAVMPLTTL